MDRKIKLSWKQTLDALLIKLDKENEIPKGSDIIYLPINKIYVLFRDVTNIKNSLYFTNT